MNSQTRDAVGSTNPVEGGAKKANREVNEHDVCIDLLLICVFFIFDLPFSQTSPFSPPRAQLASSSTPTATLVRLVRRLADRSLRKVSLDHNSMLAREA
jgi:hypothetical protein